MAEEDKFSSSTSSVRMFLVGMLQPSKYLEVLKLIIMVLNLSVVQW